MRPIKFRGKTKFSNEWIYGHYYIDMEDHFIHLDEPKDTVVAWLVRPETIGQFTGMTDMDGKEIYENDRYKWHEETGTIIFKDGQFVCEPDIPAQAFSLKSMVNMLKIVGNIHETKGGDAIEQKQD